MTLLVQIMQFWYSKHWPVNTKAAYLDKGMTDMSLESAKTWGQRTIRDLINKEITNLIIKKDPEAYGELLRESDTEAYNEWLKEFDPDAHNEWLKTEEAKELYKTKESEQAIEQQTTESTSTATIRPASRSPRSGVMTGRWRRSP